MFRKSIILINALVFLALIPALEINATHVFNPEWPAHARLHEVWQLITNSGLSIAAVWLEFKLKKPELAELLLVLINGWFLAAYMLGTVYGGSMVHSDGSELLIAGINPAFGIIVALTAALAVTSSLRTSQQRAAMSE